MTHPTRPGPPSAVNALRPPPGDREPVFGQVKHNRGADCFAAEGDQPSDPHGRLLAAIHYLLELPRRQLATA
jgi:hypothetical protein